MSMRRGVASSRFIRPSLLPSPVSGPLSPVPRGFWVVAVFASFSKRVLRSQNSPLSGAQETVVDISRLARLARDLRADAGERTRTPLFRSGFSAKMTTAASCWP